MLKTVLESLDGVDDAVKPLYAEGDDGFVLKIEGIDLHPDVKNLKTAYERVKTDKAEVAKERDALKSRADLLPEDFDAEEWAKRNNKPDLDAEAKEKLVKLRKELEAERDEAKAETAQVKSEYEGKLNRFAMERDLGDALLDAGITEPSLAKGATAMLSPMVTTSDEGKAIVESDMGPVPLGEYVKKWAAADGKSYVTPPSGGNRKGSETKAKNDNPLLEKVPALADLPEK